MDSVTFENDERAFLALVKTMKNLAKGKGPTKSPGCYSSHEVAVGRDGNKWMNKRIYHIQTIDGCIDERYSLVWEQVKN